MGSCAPPTGARLASARCQRGGAAALAGPPARGEDGPMGQVSLPLCPWGTPPVLHVRIGIYCAFLRANKPATRAHSVR
jgi:hypothetical protein